MPRIRSTRQVHEDRGVVLPLVLVMAVVISLVVVAVAGYITTSLT